MAPERDGATTAAPSSAPSSDAAETATATVAASPTASAAATSASKVLGKTDFTKQGEPACRIEFVYAGSEPEDILWEEPCADVTAKLMDRRELESLGAWAKLNDFDHKFIEALPGGLVMYVAGKFTASVYPVNETNLSYEKAVAD